MKVSHPGARLASRSASIATTIACARPGGRAPIEPGPDELHGVLVLMLTLSAPGGEERPHVVLRPDPSSDREWGERDTRLRSSDDVEHRSAPLVRGRDVEERDLVRARLVVARGAFDGVTRVAERHEAHPLHDPPVLHVEARDHAFREHRSTV